MALQSAPIQIYPGAGVPGEQALNNPPIVALPFTLNSASAAYNIVGSICCSITSNGNAAAGNTGGTLPFAGVLVNPKNYANYNGNLTPTMTLPNESLVSLATQGAFWVTLTNTNATVGQQIVFDNTTGLMTSVAAGSVLGVGKSWANARVYWNSQTQSTGVVIAIFSAQVPVSYTPAS